MYSHDLKYTVGNFKQVTLCSIIDTHTLYQQLVSPGEEKEESQTMRAASAARNVWLQRAERQGKKLIVTLTRLVCLHLYTKVT